MKRSGVDLLIAGLQLQRHPEGGWYREIYRSTDVVQSERGARKASTAVYYLLAAGEQSRWHVVASDEIWHFYRGDPLELLVYAPETETLSRTVLGCGSGDQQVLPVPRGQWQAARPLGEYALVGCTVAPGFEFEDFKFVATLPDHRRHFADRLAPFANML